MGGGKIGKTVMEISDPLNLFEGSEGWIDPLDLEGRSVRSAKEAADAQKAEIAKQSALVAKQDKMIADEQAAADVEAAERKARMAKGRKGLLYGAETGVTSNEVLGG